MPDLRRFGTWVIDLNRVVAAQKRADGLGLAVSVFLSDRDDGGRLARIDLTGEAAWAFWREYRPAPCGPTIEVIEEKLKRRAA